MNLKIFFFPPKKLHFFLMRKIVNNIVDSRCSAVERFVDFLLYVCRGLFVAQIQTKSISKIQNVWRTLKFRNSRCQHQIEQIDQKRRILSKSVKSSFAATNKHFPSVIFRRTNNGLIPVCKKLKKRKKNGKKEMTISFFWEDTEKLPKRIYLFHRKRDIFRSGTVQSQSLFSKHRIRSSPVLLFQK